MVRNTSFIVDFNGNFLIRNNKTAISLDSALAAINNDFFFYMMVGLTAQLVDGTLVMTYRITSTSSFGAFLVNKIRRRPLMILVGTIVILLSLRTILKGFHLI